MEFKNMFQNKMLLPVLLLIVVILVLLGISFFKTGSSELAISNTSNPVPIVPVKENVVEQPVQGPIPVSQSVSHPAFTSNSSEDVEIQDQLDRDRQQQKLTKDLKNKLEQTNLELEQEKALSEINKLKKENLGSFNDTSEDGQNNLPEVKVEYIGGDSVKKEAILSIGNTSYQVKEKSSPTDNIQILSISDTSVTIHFSSPQNLTKTIEFKPE